LFQIILSLIKKEEEVIIIIKSLIVLAIIQSIIALFQIISPTIINKYISVFSYRDGSVSAMVVAGINRASGTISDYEILAEWLAAISPLCLAMLFISDNKKVLFFISFLIVTFGIVSTVTRGGLIAEFLGIMAFILGSSNKPLLIVKRLFIVLFFLIIAFILLNKFYSNQLVAFLFRLSETNINSNLLRSSGSFFQKFARLLNREIWLRQPTIVSEFTLIGKGFYEVKSIHSLIYTIYFQNGIIGLTLWFFLFLRVGYYLLKSRINSTNTQSISILGALIGGYIATIVSEIKVEFLRYDFSMQFFFLFIGICISSAKIYSLKKIRKLN
jgi:hypothetical protein